MSAINEYKVLQKVINEYVAEAGKGAYSIEEVVEVIQELTRLLGISIEELNEYHEEPPDKASNPIVS